MSWIAIAGLLLLLLIFTRFERDGERSTSNVRRSSVATASEACSPSEGVLVLPMSDLDDELVEFVRSQYRQKASYYALELASGERIAVGHTPGEGWLDVAARKRRRGETRGVYTGPYAMFGYSCSEGRWSHGEGPPGASEIRGLLAEHFRARSSGRWS